MKKNKLLKISLLLILPFFIQNNSASAQACYEFHKTAGCDLGSGSGFREYGQSKSGILQVNKMFEYKLVLYGEKDYKIGICTESGRGPVHYRILEARSKNVLFDNSTDEYIESVGFTNVFSQTIIIEITVLEEEDIEIEDGDELLVCVGINILWRKTPKIGF
ncbi:MAG: hypothetical protein PF485_10155 [Bacteroidales bacterium]|jgi:hypothetical protein|nr:hypothetical protein [Bacteroidales bacterium]